MDYKIEALELEKSLPIIEKDIKSISDKNIIIEITENFLSEYKKIRNYFNHSDGYVSPFFQFDKHYNFETKKFEDISGTQFKTTNKHIMKMKTFNSKYVFKETTNFLKFSNFNCLCFEPKNFKEMVLYFLLEEDKYQRIDSYLIIGRYFKSDDYYFFKNKINDFSIFIYNIFTLFKYSEDFYNKFLNDFIPDSINITLGEMVNEGVILKEIEVTDFKEKFSKKFPYTGIVHTEITEPVYNISYYGMKKLISNDLYTDILPSYWTNNNYTNDAVEYLLKINTSNKNSILLTYTFFVLLLNKNKEDIDSLIENFQYRFNDMNTSFKNALILISNYVENPDEFMNEFIIDNNFELYAQEKAKIARIKNFINNDFNSEYLFDHDKYFIKDLINDGLSNILV